MKERHTESVVVAVLALLAAAPGPAFAADRSPPDRREVIRDKADSRRETRETIKAAEMARQAAAQRQAGCVTPAGKSDSDCDLECARSRCAAPKVVPRP